nr:hypothetical protein [uncultured organism]
MFIDAASGSRGKTLLARNSVSWINDDVARTNLSSSFCQVIIVDGPNKKVACGLTNRQTALASLMIGADCIHSTVCETWNIWTHTAQFL